MDRSFDWKTPCECAGCGEVRLPHVGHGFQGVLLPYCVECSRELDEDVDSDERTVNAQRGER